MTFTAPIQLPGLALDHEWYRRAVFYEVMVRSFVDSNGDGSGDLAGLISRLDYLQWLGIDALWLPPIYSSPLRDGGYDVSDFRSILPEFGTVEEFRELVRRAHERNMRIIIDYPINHTSDAHEWFQQSRADPDGPYGDYYVWSDSDEKYPNIRVIFVDTEESNWAFDPVRRQFFFHRFFSHQPDLNFENPAVREEVLGIVRFWLDMGVDGIRLDAIPYLFESDDGNGEGEPQTHEFLREMRAMLDRDYPGRILIAEANQWPQEVLSFFGTEAEPECHMAFDFPVMPRIFYSLRAQQAGELVRILSETTDVPPGAGWGVFLRNHDELTLEMVTDEERDYMYSEYAKDPRMKANVGIRRRLAPLLENDHGQVKLFNGLLLSLPGSPVLYYGDEIGMGDNIYLGDRDGVRTPMQWNADRNAGFSQADPQRLYLPLILDPVYGYQGLNVDAQSRSQTSLLNWTRKMLGVRKQHPVFGMGTYEELEASNPSVLAFCREFGDDKVVCVNNLSRFPQPVELDLSRYQDRRLVELTGGVPFPPIGELPYLLSLPGHGFLWFSVRDVT